MLETSSGERAAHMFLLSAPPSSNGTTEGLCWRGELPAVRMGPREKGGTADARPQTGGALGRAGGHGRDRGGSGRRRERRVGDAREDEPTPPAHPRRPPART